MSAPSPSPSHKRSTSLTGLSPFASLESQDLVEQDTQQGGLLNTNLLDDAPVEVLEDFGDAASYEVRPALVLQEPRICTHRQNWPVLLCTCTAQLQTLLGPAQLLIGASRPGMQFEAPVQGAIATPADAAACRGTGLHS